MKETGSPKKIANYIIKFFLKSSWKRLIFGMQISTLN